MGKMKCDFFFLGGGGGGPNITYAAMSRGISFWKYNLGLNGVIFHVHKWKLRML